MALYAHGAVTAWVSYLNMAILIGTLAVALFNASKDPIARNFAYVYAIISVGILVRTLASYPQHPLTVVISSDIRLCSVPESYHHDPQT